MTEAERAALQQRLAEAENALHLLQIGQSVVEARDESGESVRMTAANVGRLKSYIADLRAQLGLACIATAQRGPMRIRY